MAGPLTKYAREHGSDSGPKLDPMSALLEMYELEQVDAANRRTPYLDWALRVPEPKSGTLDFDRFPFQRELYAEGAYEKEMVIKKATQLGISAWLTRWVMYHADIGALVALYVFPKLAQMYDFADARVKQAILGSEYLRGRVPPAHVQNKGLRQIGLGMVYFRGSETKTALDSVDADVLALDEYDTLTQENIPDAEKRISGSDVALIRRVGVPSTPNWGIDKLYCVAPDTRVLRADLSWTTASKVGVYDELVAFDETSLPGNQGRRFRKTKVEAVRRLSQPCRRVRAADGTEVVCSDDHRWLVISGNNARWKTTRRLKAGDKLLSIGTWTEDRSREAGWLAGFFDGEGSVCRSQEGRTSQITLPQNEGVALDTLRTMLRDRGFSWHESPQVHSDCIQIRLKGGLPERLRFLGSIRPVRLMEKADRAWEDVRIGGAARRIEVESVESVGDREVVAFQTQHRTFIAEGLLSHNSESDQRRWMVKCESCRTHQHIEFPDNVDLEKAIVICKKCRKPLDVRKGEWVAEHPDREVRGYHIPRLVKPNTNVKEIIKASKASNPTLKKTHFNKDLGLAYADEEGRLSDEAIAAACRAYSMTLDGGYTGDRLVTMGVDVASARALNVRISVHLEGDRKRALWIGRVDSFDEVINLMRRFNVKMCAIDHAPEERLARKVAEKFPGRVYLVVYAQNAKEIFTVDEEMKRAVVRRVEAIDATYDLIRRQLNELPGGRTGDPEALPEGYKEELQGEVRETEKDEFGRETVRYRKTGPNDYTHAEVYDVVATECWHYRQGIEDAQRETFQPLDEMLEFQRAALEPEDDDLGYYEPGLEDTYEAGFGE